MLALHVPSVVCPPEEPVWRAVEKLSSCWLNVDWNSWPASSREVAKTLVSIGAIELRIKCTLRKQGTPTPLLVFVWGRGDFWPALNTELSSIAETAVRWKGRPGEIHIETVKEAIRWSLEGEKAWRAGKLDPDEMEQWLRLSTARLEVESYQFSDDAPFPGGTKREDPLSAPIVTWSLGSE